MGAQVGRGQPARRLQELPGGEARDRQGEACEDKLQEVAGLALSRAAEGPGKMGTKH